MSVEDDHVSSVDVTTHHAHGPASVSAQPDASAFDSSSGKLQIQPICRAFLMFLGRVDGIRLACW